MNNSELFKTVFDKYELSCPAAADVRLAIYYKKKAILKNIIKKQGLYSLFISAVISFFLWVKKYGISISVAKSAIAVSAAVAISAGAIAVSAGYAVKKIMIDKEVILKKIEPIKEQPAEIAVLLYSVAVARVRMNDVSEDRIVELTNETIQELRKIRGSLTAVDMSGLDEYHVSDKILSISILKVKDLSKGLSEKEGVYRISAKVIDRQSSEVLLVASETANGEERIIESLKNLAKKISASL